MRDDAEKQSLYHGLGEDYFWLAAHYDVAQTTVTPYLEKLGHANAGTPLKILDAGCGPGHFLGRLKNLGIIYGTDFSKDALVLGAQKHQVPNFVSNLEFIPMRDNSLDCVAALEVIEHVENDVMVLREFYRILKPGGIGLISVPAFMSLWGDHDEWNGHFRRYERRELLDKIQEAGFHVADCQYFKCLFFLPLYLVRRVKKLFSFTMRQGDFYQVNPYLNRFLRWLINQEVKWGLNTKLPFGVTLLCVVQKPKTAELANRNANPLAVSTMAD